MKRVVVTGMGIISCIGNGVKTVKKALKASKSGIVFDTSSAEHGLSSRVAGLVRGFNADGINRTYRRFMSQSAQYGYVAAREAIDMAKLTVEDIQTPRVGIFLGNGGTSLASIMDYLEVYEKKRQQDPEKAARIGSTWVPKVMNSGPAANLAVALGIRGTGVAVSSACATSVHAVGLASQQIAWGTHDIILAGGVEESAWAMTLIFDSMGALSRSFNDTPATASRPYDANRDGFVIAEGAGIVVLEEREHALSRGATIYGEILGFGSTSDGKDAMVLPTGEGAERCMHMAMQGLDVPIDYINTHGTGTPKGDVVELEAVGRVFDRPPPLSSTKGMTGHSLGATGAQELIFCLLMMGGDFIVPSINIENLDPACASYPIVQELQEGVKLKTVMTNSFGFGGTNATLVVGLRP